LTSLNHFEFFLPVKISRVESVICINPKAVLLGAPGFIFADILGSKRDSMAINDLKFLDLKSICRLLYLRHSVKKAFYIKI